MAAKSLHMERIARLRKQLKERGLDAFVVLNRTNTRYLTGFAGSYSVTIVDGNSARFITDSRYAEIAEGALDKGFQILCRPTKDVAAYFEDIYKKSGYRKIGFEESITVAEFDALGKLTKKAKSKLERAEAAILDMRAVKDETELAIIKKAVALADRMMANAQASIKAGMSELELSKIIRRSSEDLGGEGQSFDNIVASGPNASKPHHRGSTRKMKAGDMVTIDLGGVVGGYCSDLTRTPALGKITQKFEAIYNACLEANMAAIKGIRPGMTGEEADQFAREVIEKAGYGKFFGHGLGHGVGLEIHEGPRLAPESKAKLVPGMIVTIEPGIYVPGFGGVRIEDYCLITDKGVKVLSKAPKELVALPV